MTHKKTATRIGIRLYGWKGDARLYKLSPPLKGYDFVVVSATTVPNQGPETYIFPSEPDGQPAHWTELPGSFRGGLDHDKALRDAGYETEKPS